ncbi:glycosyl hydrolase family 18 protein [Bacillus sp. FJAT-45066]|uniref:glycosyl hydrolase family 18 protein n=1 Tax=Bacillus sp. FJAT-45066 TaxID=2011010 RepID=UPI0020CFEB56|nr:glycosyl hydrolase family 18 protein [Bacillus sp. FJAT-45066]
MDNLEVIKKKKLQKPVIILGICFAISLILTSFVWIIYPLPSKEKVLFTQLNHPILFKGELMADEALIQDDVIYLPVAFYLKHIDPQAMLDEESNSIIITTKNKVMQMPSDSLTYFVNEEEFTIQFPTLMEAQSNLYVAITPLLEYYSISVELLPSTGIVKIMEHGEIMLEGIVLEAKEHLLKVRTGPSLVEPFYSNLFDGESVAIVMEEQGFYYIRQNHGIAGYVPKDVIELKQPSVVTLNKEYEPVTMPRMDWPINLTWEAVYSYNPDTNSLPTMAGINVVSPTWFHIANEEGDISNLGSMEYVQWAKDRGYQIWALFANDFTDLDMTHEVFRSYETRQKMIRQLLAYSQMYELDGINFDIENVRVEDGPYITQFVKEATPLLHQAGLVVSMDVTFISQSPTWSMFYEREKLSNIVDYMMIMAYDEHWGTSPVAGSVASLPWVEENLKKILKEIPHEKLVLGIPLYTRLWKEEETEAGNIQVSSRALSMTAVENWVKERELTPILDEDSRQNYVEYFD